MYRLLFLIICAFSSIAAHAAYKIFSGSANNELAQSIANDLQTELGKMAINRFNDGEVRIQILDNVRNCDVFIIQSTCKSEHSTINDNLTELYLTVRALKRASAKSVTAVIPYFGYARQDRRLDGRVPISASDMAMLLETAGVDRVVAVDLHCGQIQGFFRNASIDNLLASYVFAPEIAEMGIHNPVIVSPDAGGVERAKSFIESLSSKGVSASLAMIIKQRAGAGVIDTMNLVGDVAGHDAIIVDDICDTAGTLVEAAKILKAQGATRVFACITHPLFSGPACSRIAQSSLDKIFVTDTIPANSEETPKIQVVSVAHLIAQAIHRMDHNESISALFDWKGSSKTTKNIHVN